jgi:hypothetical protein
MPAVPSTIMRQPCVSSLVIREPHCLSIHYKRLDLGEGSGETIFGFCGNQLRSVGPFALPIRATAHGLQIATCPQFWLHQRMSWPKTLIHPANHKSGRESPFGLLAF